MIKISREEEEIEELFVEIVVEVEEDKVAVEEEEVADLEQEEMVEVVDLEVVDLEVVDLEGEKEEVVVDMVIVIDLMVGKGLVIEIGQIIGNSKIIINFSVMMAGEGIISVQLNSKIQMMIGRVVMPGVTVILVQDKRETLLGNHLAVGRIIPLEPGEVEMEKVQQAGDLI